MNTTIEQEERWSSSTWQLNLTLHTRAAYMSKHRHSLSHSSCCSSTCNVNRVNDAFEGLTSRQLLSDSHRDWLKACHRSILHHNTVSNKCSLDNGSGIFEYSIKNIQKSWWETMVNHQKLTHYQTWASRRFWHDNLNKKKYHSLAVLRPQILNVLFCNVKTQHHWKQSI